MNRRLIFLASIIMILSLSCNFPFLVSEDDLDGDIEESVAEVEGEEVEIDSEREISSHDPPLSLDENLLFFRDFSFELPIFSPDSAWNQRADGAAVLTESDAQILSLYRVLLGDISTLVGYSEPATDWPYMSISLYDFTVPIFRTGDGFQDVWICQDEGEIGWAHPKFGIETEGGPVTVPAPAGLVRPSGPNDSQADGWLVLYDPETHTAYDYIGATPHQDDSCEGFQGGLVGDKILQAGVVDFFDLQGLGASPDGYYSARAVGTPLLAGLILPEDIENGVIAHALAFAIPGPRNTSRNPFEPKKLDYFYPVSTTETDFYNTDPNSLASGQRIRLKETLVDEDGQTIDESEFSPITAMFLAALRDYGAYLVDNSGGFTFYVEDVHTAVLHLTDDEVNTLVGNLPGTVLPEGATKWQIVIEKLGNDLELIPLAAGPEDEELTPETAQIATANFEVVEPADLP